MKNGFLKKSLSAVLSAAMLLTVTPAMLAGAVDGEVENELGLVWPDAGTTQWGGEGTVPEWAQNATPDEQQATIDAINKEYQDQKAAGYDLGQIEHPEFTGNGFSSWADMVNVQFVGGDNQGNPWGQTNRNWACIIAPFPGMAFSVKGEVVQAFTNPKTAISNQFEWTDPRTGVAQYWQMFDDGEYFIGLDGTGAVNNGWGYAPGSTLSGPVVDAMVRTYADYAYYEDFIIGMTEQDGQVDENGIVYQEFFGPDSTGKTQQTDRQDTEYGSFGITYMVAKSQDATDVYIVTGDILTAWATTWGDPTSSNPDRFSASGVPVADQVTDEDGNVSQEFEKVIITVSADGETTIQSKDNTMQDFAIEGGVVFQDGNDINVVVPNGTNVTALTPTFTIDEQATAQPASGVAQDFTDPVTYTVTSGAGESNVYTVTVSVAPATPDPDDQAAADAVMEQINALPAYDDIYLNDRETIAAARAAYEALEPLQKIIIVNDLDKLTEAEQAIANLEANPLRVAMVGDSITEGAGASNSYRNYVSQAAAILGDEFDVLNVGRGGMTLMSTPEAYTNTEQYQQGLDFNPDIVTIMLGTNDGKDRYWGMYSETQYNAAQFEEEMTELINSYRELPSRPIVFVATSPTVYGKQVDTIDNKYVTEIVEVQKKVAADMGCPVIDINTFTQNHSEWFGDGVHPNDAGYAEIAKEFAAAVAEVNKAELDTIQVGEMTIEVESGVTEYTGFIPEGTEIPEIIVEGAYGATYEIGEVSDQLPSSVEITVYSKNGNYRNTYTLNLEQGEIPVTIVPGDLDNDEEVTIADVMEACKVMARESAGTDPSDDEIKRGDLDGDEEITIADVMEICKILARQ